MLNFKVKSNAIDINSQTPLEDYLRTLGITEVNEFIYRPSVKNELPGYLLNNVPRAIEMLRSSFENNKNIFLIVDCDTDGFTSSAIFYNYFHHLYPNSNIQWMLHEEKQHGIELDKIPENAEVIIVPDAGSNQIEELTFLNKLGKTVIVMDHHQVEKELPFLSHICVINNQNSELFNNKSLSGAGVTFKVLQEYNKTYHSNDNYINTLYDLAALGIIADCMDSRTLDNNYIIYKGLKNLNNKMFKALIDKQNYSIDSETPNKIDVAYYIAPLINGTIRMGTMEQKELLFQGFIEAPTQDSFEHTWRGNTTTEDFYHHVARIAYNVKNEQNRKKMKCLEFLQKRIETEGLDKNQIIVVITKEDDEVPVPKTITGLVAMELLKLYGKPSLVLRPTIDGAGNLTYTGSGRSNSFEELPSFLAFVREQEESVYAQGHACAFGASIKGNELQHFIDACNEKMSHIDFANDTIYVDAHFADRVNSKIIYDFAKGKDIYGNQIPQPLIAISGLISKSDIKIMGTDGSSVKITIKNIPCIKFKSKELAQKLSAIKSCACITVIGRPNLNNYMGIETPQLFIDYIDFEEIQNYRGLF